MSEKTLLTSPEKSVCIWILYQILLVADLTGLQLLPMNLDPQALFSLFFFFFLVSLLTPYLFPEGNLFGKKISGKLLRTKIEIGYNGPPPRAADRALFLKSASGPYWYCFEKKQKYLNKTNKNWGFWWKKVLFGNSVVKSLIEMF